MKRRIVTNSILFCSLLISSFTAGESAQCKQRVRRVETFTKCNKNPCETKSTRNVTLFQRGRVWDNENRDLAYSWPSLNDGELSDQLTR